VKISDNRQTPILGLWHHDNLCQKTAPHISLSVPVSHLGNLVFHPAKQDTLWQWQWYHSA